jgi:ribonucleoside-diphosphate reductase alpha chain
MQAAFQKNCDSSVSKTINMPNEVTEDDVRTAYWQAYKGGCKGVTIYRDGSRQNQVLSTGATPESSDQSKFQAEAPPIPPKEAAPKQRPVTLEGFTEKIITGYGNLYITVNKFGNKPFEVFAQIGKSGYSTMADTEAISRLISLALRSGINVDDIIEQLTGIGGASPIYQKGEMVMSIPDAIAKVLKKHFGNGHHKVDRDVNLEFCPDCGGRIQHESGCMVCPSCGYSKC